MKSIDFYIITEKSVLIPDGKIKTILKTERPWSPTGVTVRDGTIYALEYTNANGPAKERWFPRIRKNEKDGRIKIISDFSSGNM